MRKYFYFRGGITPEVFALYSLDDYQILIGNFTKKYSMCFRIIGFFIPDRNFKLESNFQALPEDFAYGEILEFESNEEAILWFKLQHPSGEIVQEN